MEVKFKWDKICVGITTVSLLIIGIVISMLLIELSNHIWNALLIILLVTVTVATMAYCPVKLVVDEKAITVKRIIGQLSIPFDKMQSIEEQGKINMWSFKHMWDTIRMWGSGGLFGYMGYWYNVSLGKFIIYATANEKYLLIKTEKMQYLIGCENPAEVISYVEKMKTVH